MRIDSKLVHAGAAPEQFGGAGVLPITRSTIYQHVAGADYHEILYPRLSTLPGQVHAGRAIAAVESAEAGLVTASGMAAISTALLATLGQGGHLIAHRSLYGGTRSLCTADLPAMGHEVSFVDATDSSGWADALRPNSRAIYVEAMTNPTLEIADHRAVVEFARANGLVSMIDATFATPINFRPIELGYDLVLHSATKYLNCHSDVVAGAVAGSADRVGKVKGLLDHLGGCIDPQAAYLLLRGMKTLGLRVRRQNESALAVARALADDDRISRVVYPGLPSHPHHDRARELFAGCGGMLAIELAGGAAVAERFVGLVKMALHSASLGGPETLVTRPVTSSHAGVPKDELDRLGITEGLIRVSIGLEDPADILDDFDQALTAAAG